MPDTSLPPIKAVLNASLAIAGGIACAALAAYQMREGGAALVVGLFGLCVGLTLIVTHYWGLFHRRPTWLLVATIATIPAFVYVGRSLPAVIESLFELPEVVVWYFLPVVSFTAALGLALPCVWETAHWQMVLKKAEDRGHSPSGFQAISLKEMLAAVAIIGLIIAPTSFAIQSDPFLYLEDVPTTAAPVSLPPEGTNMRFHRNAYGVILASFQVKEEDLLKWIEERKQVPGNLGFRPRPMPVGYSVMLPSGYKNGIVQHEFVEFDDAYHIYWDNNGWRHEVSYSPSHQTAIYIEREPFGF
ncbi:hypothetical protein C5Y96_11245 [Blastopirellula marina]|uniref:Uncharacterized protein n=1 Tax=Blastopirellula marina TaxID=124 RepID=A0A2S8FMI4_9BACT|nr:MULTISPECIES: hypothetical protein [Pirellulaceae]PQO33413.1 hypothetical protein C5Y96_11245 [Blastopirellula marina]RCS52503.1 hypothetical protein DTL36_11255 [Bremerella cremea]